MKRIPRGILCVLALLALVVSARAQFTLDLHPISPGTVELRFTLEPDYYYCLESSGDLTGTFAPASGWMLGSGSEAAFWLNVPPGIPASA